MSDPSRATKGERRKFNEIIEFAKSQEETISIIADAVDRIQRGFKESVILDELIRQEKIGLHFIRENSEKALYFVHKFKKSFTMAGEEKPNKAES